MKAFGIILLFFTLYGVTGGNDHTDAEEEAMEVERVGECVMMGGCDD